MVEDEGPIARANTLLKTNYTWAFNSDQTKLLVTSPVSASESGTISIDYANRLQAPA